MKVAIRFLVVLTSVSLFSISTAFGTVVNVQLLDFSFSPDSVTVNAGDTILWTNNGAFFHTSTSGAGCFNSGIWDSGTLNPGQMFDRTFSTVGTFPYHCTFHCSIGMVGTAVVQVIPGVEEEEKRRSQNISIARVQPNPFRGATSIFYSLREEANVKIDIFDLIGRRVRTLVNAHQDPGLQRVLWDGMDDDYLQVKSAIYFVRIQTPTSKEVRKMVLMK